MDGTPYNQFSGINVHRCEVCQQEAMMNQASMQSPQSAKCDRHKLLEAQAEIRKLKLVIESKNGQISILRDTIRDIIDDIQRKLTGAK